MLYKVFFLAWMFSLVLPLAGLGQKQPAPDSIAEKELVKPDKRKTPPKELVEVVEQVLKQQQHQTESNLDFEIDGLVIDETLTKVGHDYYDVFYSNWEAPAQINNYTIKVKERPLRGRGFQIIVLVNDTEIIEENLNPQFDLLEAAALNGVQQTLNYLLNYENLKNQLDTDDRQGTGLY